MRGGREKRGRWEDVDAVGDEVRIVLIGRWVAGFGVVVALGLVLVVLGDSTLRVLGLVVISFSLVMLIPLLASAASSRRRIREGKALTSGDPYRTEGIGQDDSDAR